MSELERGGIQELSKDLGQRDTIEGLHPVPESMIRSEINRVVTSPYIK